MLADPESKTMRIHKCDGIVTVEFAPDFVSGLSIRQTTAVLAHELNHLAFGHLAHSRDRYPHDLARTISEEVCANEWLDVRDLPGAPVLLAHFPELSPGQSFQERYEILAALPLEDDPRAAGLGEELKRRQQDAGTVSIADVRRMAEAAITDLGHPVATKGIPGEMQRAIMRGIGAGSEAGDFTGLVHAAGGKPTVSWAAKLRRFLGDGSRIQPTYCRPSRRHPEMVGLVPGSETKPQNPRILLVLDSSGSMSDELLGEVLREIRGILPHSEAWLIQCDTKIHEMRRFDLNEAAKPFQVRGRGGTDFRPALSPTILRKIRPGWIIFFTDGYGPAPETPPPCRIAWVLGGRNPHVPADYGEVIKLGDGSLFGGSKEIV